MKKKTDYFEMLKKLGFLNVTMFRNIMNHISISEERIDFNALISSFYDYLLAEFVPPISRESLYDIASSLQLQQTDLMAVSLIGMTGKAASDYGEAINRVFDSQYDMICNLKNIKTPRILLPKIKEVELSVRTVQNGLVRDMKTATAGDLFIQSLWLQKLVFSCNTVCDAVKKTVIINN